MKTRNKRKRFTLLLLFSLVLGSLTIQAQNLQATAANSTIKVEGTSNLHDWDIKAEQFTVNATINASGDAITIDKLNLELVAEQLKSGKRGMDSNTYKALDTKKHKNIRFTSSKTVRLDKVSENTYKVVMQGEMEIAGTKKTTDIAFDVVKTTEGFTLKGAKEIHMPEYNITPPTALMGTVKTGADVTITYTLTLK